MMTTSVAFAAYLAPAFIGVMSCWAFVTGYNIGQSRS